MHFTSAQDYCQEPQATLSDFDHTKQRFFPRWYSVQIFSKKQSNFGVEEEICNAPYFGSLDLWMPIISYYCHLLATGGDAVWGRSRRGEGRGWVDRGTGQTQVLSQPFARHAWHQNKQSLLKFPDPFWTTCVDFFQVWWSLPNSWAEQREDYW